MTKRVLLLKARGLFGNQPLKFEANELEMRISTLDGKWVLQASPYVLPDHKPQARLFMNGVFVGLV